MPLMNNYVPLAGSDISRHLQTPRGCGVSRGTSADGIPTVELTSNPAVHGPHGAILIQPFRAAPLACAINVDADTKPAPLPALVADLRTANEYLRGMSDDSVRFWGDVGSESNLFIFAAAAVRVVVCAVDGSVLAGPLEFDASVSRVDLVW